MLQLCIGLCGFSEIGRHDSNQGGLRVPQAAVWPGRIQPGSSTDVATLSMDLFATCCEAAGAACRAGRERIALAAQSRMVDVATNSSRGACV